MEQLAFFLWERLLIFWPSIAMLAGIMVISKAYFMYLTRWYSENLKSAEWIKENGLKIFFSFSLPTLLICGPVVEELIFRMPLIIAFDSVTPLAWVCIGVSSIIFGLIHWGSKFSQGFQRGLQSTPEEVAAENAGTEIKLDPKRERRVFIQRIGQVFSAGILGILAGYYGILYQSVWVSVGIHMAWNVAALFVFPIFVGLIVLVAVLAVKLYSAIENRIYWWRRRRRYPAHYTTR